MPSAFQSYKPKHLQVYGVICLNTSGNVLLVKGKRSKLWSFPKGHCESNESDIQCAKREFYEETGLTLPSLDVFSNKHKMKGGVYFIHTIEDEPTPEPVDSREIEEAKWFSLHKIPTLDTNIDVSIFRSLMRNIPRDNPHTFVDSLQARRRIQMIRQNIG